MGEAAAGAVEEGCIALAVERGPDQRMVRAFLYDTLVMLKLRLPPCCTEHRITLVLSLPLTVDESRA